MDHKSAKRGANLRAIQTQGPYVQQQEIPAQSIDPKRIQHPVYARLPSPVGFAANGWPIYADGDLQRAASLLISYPHQVPSPSPPPSTNTNSNRKFPPMEYAYVYPASIGCGDDQRKGDSLPPREQFASKRPSRSNSAPPPSPNHRLPPADQHHTDGIESQHRRQQDDDSKEEVKSPRSEQVRPPKTVPESSILPMMPSPNDSDASCHSKDRERNIFPSPSSSPIGSSARNRTYSSVAAMTPTQIEQAPNDTAQRSAPSKPPLSQSTAHRHLSPSKPTKPPLPHQTSKPRYHYQPNAPRIIATRSQPRVNPTEVSSSKKRRNRRREMIEQDRKAWDAAHRLPIFPSSWHESTDDEPASQSNSPNHGNAASPHTKKKCRRKNKRKKNNANNRQTKPIDIEQRIKGTHKVLKQSLIDDYLEKSDDRRYKTCLLCMKKRYLPSHLLDCPSCSKPLYTDSSSDSDESSSSQELPIKRGNHNATSMKKDTANKPSTHHSTPPRRIPLHPDIRESNRMQRKFGVKFTSPSQREPDSMQPDHSRSTQSSVASKATMRQTNSVHPAASDDAKSNSAALTVDDYVRISHEIDRDYQKLNELYPETLASPQDAHTHNIEQQPSEPLISTGSNSSTLAPNLSWIPMERRHLNISRVSDSKTRCYPDSDTVDEIVYHAYNKQYSRESIKEFSTASKHAVFDIMRFHLRDVERYNVNSRIHEDSPSNQAWLSCLDRYKFKAAVHSPSRVKAGSTASFSDMDEDTAPDTDDDDAQSQTVATHPTTPPRRIATSLSTNKVILRPTLPAVSPVVDDDNNVVQFSLPPPLPALAEPAKEGQIDADIMKDWHFDEKIRRCGIFGKSKLNRSDLNTFMVALLFALCPGDVSVKVFYKERETARSKAIHCIFNHHPQCRGKCRLCQQKKTHHGCRVESCKKSWIIYAADPDEAANFKALSCSQGNNAILLSHINSEHVSIARELRRRAIAYCRTNPRYVYSVIVPVHKYAAIQRNHSQLRRYQDTEQRIQAEDASMAQVLDTAHQGRMLPENDAAQIHKTIAARWCCNVTLHLMNPYKEPLKSQCPRGVAKKQQCRLKSDGTVGKRQPIYLPDKVRFVRVAKMKCSRHNYNKLNCTVKDLRIVEPDRFNMSLFRNGNGLLTPMFVINIVQKYRTVGHRISKLRQYLIETYADTFWTDGHQHMDRALVIKVMASFVPSQVTLNKYLRTGQRLIYQPCLDNQISTYLRTSPHMFGFDQTYKRLARMKGIGATTTDVGLATTVSAQGILVKLGLLNNKAENFDQWARLLGELKAECLRYGNLEYLKHAGFCWGSDNYKNTKNLPQLINQFVLDNIASNPHYSYIAEKLAEHECTVADFVDNIVECGMHKFMRDYRAMKEIGIHPGSHSDFSLYTQAHIDMMNELQSGIDELVDLIQSDWVNIRDVPADQGYVRAIAWYHFWREQLEIDGLDAKIFKVLTAILKLEGIQDFAAKNEAIRDIKNSADYLDSLQAVLDITERVHPAQRRWLLGRWINAENRVNKEWAECIRVFLDGRGQKVTVYYMATTQQITNIINRFFLTDPLEYTRHLILYPLYDWVELQYAHLRDSIACKRCEGEESEMKALWDYPEVRKQWQLASTSESIQAMVNTRSTQYSSAWLNVLNEQIHKRLAEMFETVRTCQSPECLLMDLNVQQYHLNDTKFDKILQRDPDAFDLVFKHDLKEIRQELAMPSLFKRVIDEGLIVDISHIYRQIVKETNDALDARAIHIKHPRVMRRAEKQLLGTEITMLRPKEITVDLVIHLHAKHKKSVISIIRELTKYGIPSAKCVSTGLPITANPGRIYERLKQRDFDPIHFLPAIDVPETTNSSTNSLPPVPIQYVQNQEQSPAVVAAMIELHSRLVELVRFLNENIPSLKADTQKVHAMDLESSTLKEYVYGLFDDRKRTKLWSTVFNVQQMQSVKHYTSDKSNVEALCMNFGIEHSSSSLFTASYTLCHATQPVPKVTAITLKYGGDSTTNYKYDKKRTSSKAGFDDGGNGKKRRVVKWKQLYKFNKHEDEYKNAVTVRCSCNLDEFEKDYPEDTKYGPWLTVKDAIAEMKQLSMYLINEGGVQRLRRYAKAHGFEAKDKHGSSLGFIRDWLIAHLLLNKDLNAMDTENIKELFVNEKLIKKVKRKRRK